MPNWCSNVVTFSHSDTAAIKRVAEAYVTGKFMTQFFPCPKELIGTVSGAFSDAGEQAMLEAQQAANSLKYGYPSWYEWSIDNWGVKWDFGDTDAKLGYVDGNTEITLTFDTAWSPPTDFYAKMVDELGYKVKAYYYEGGMAFCGIWNNGDDTAYDIPSHSSEVADKIPQAIDEMFNIAGNMEIWEDEDDHVNYMAEEVPG